MRELPTVTMVAITDSDVGNTVDAILKSLKHIKPRRTILFTTAHIDRPEFETIVIPPMGSARAYNEFVTWKLGCYCVDGPIAEGHILLVQHDGYVLDGNQWTDEFLNYDYIGAPWFYTDGRNVGNGGFSLRSTKLHLILASDPEIKVGSPEDEIICRLYRHLLELNHGIKYAPDKLAHKFSFELHRPLQPTFGFHQYHHEPYREPIILRLAQNGIGDLVMLEPVMEWYNSHGYRVILDVPFNHFHIFQNHYFKVDLAAYLTKANENLNSYRVIDLTMAYEIQPKQLVLKSYFQACGISNYELRNSRLTPVSLPLFKKYCVIHVNKTDMPYRNAKKIRWWPIVEWLETEGYTVIEVGNKPDSGSDLPERYRIRAINEQMLAYIIGGASLFIGSDSGPSQIAVACGVKSIIMFGSVKPEYRYHDLSNIVPIVLPCAFPSCYHDTPGSRRGTDCVIDLNNPPCATYQTQDIMNVIEQL